MILNIQGTPGKNMSGKHFDFYKNNIGVVVPCITRDIILICKSQHVPTQKLANHVAQSLPRYPCSVANRIVACTWFVINLKNHNRLKSKCSWILPSVVGFGSDLDRFESRYVHIVICQFCLSLAGNKHMNRK